MALSCINEPQFQENDEKSLWHQRFHRQNQGLLCVCVCVMYGIFSNILSLIYFHVLTMKLTHKTIFSLQTCFLVEGCFRFEVVLLGEHSMLMIYFRTEYHMLGSSDN
jgi:hypothetical protein